MPADGTVYLGTIPTIPGVMNFIKDNWNRLDFHFLSNNTSEAEEHEKRFRHSLEKPFFMPIFHACPPGT